MPLRLSVSLQPVLVFPFPERDQWQEFLSKVQKGIEALDVSADLVDGKAEGSAKKDD